MSRKQQTTIQELRDAYHATIVKGKNFDDMAEYCKVNGFGTPLAGSLQSRISSLRAEANRLSATVEYKGKKGAFAEVVGNDVSPIEAIPNTRGGINEVHAGVKLLKMGEIGDKLFPKVTSKSVETPQDKLSAFSQLIDL